MSTRIHVTTESLQPSAERWNSTYTTFRAVSSLFTSSSSIQTLEFDQLTNELSILGGNIVSLSSLANTGLGMDTAVRSLTSQWNSTYTTVNANSAVVWNYQGTDLKDLSANWQETYTTFRDASSTFLTSETDSQTLTFNETTKDLSISNGNTVSLSGITASGAYLPLSGGTVTGNLSVSDSFEVGTGGISTLYADGNLVGINTKTPNEELTVVGSLSVTEIVYALGGDSNVWNEVYTSYSSSSSTFLTSETDSQTLSFDEVTKDLSISNGNIVSLSSFGTGADIEVRALTADWIGGNEAYTNLIANSAAYLSSVDLSFLSVSANWESVYSTVQANSGTFVKTVATTTPGSSAVNIIIAVSALPITPDPNTLYIVI